MEAEKSKEVPPPEEMNAEETKDDEEDPTTFNRIEEILKENDIDYDVATHKAAITAQESADVRGATLESGAKSMLIVDRSKKLNSVYFLCVMSAAEKINWKLIKEIIGTKKLKLATVEEVLTQTGCAVGGVPPFGSLFNVHTYVDNSLVEQGETISFNAGLKTRSILMKTEDYLKVENPNLCNFIVKEEPKSE
ncbi:unnamed protein product [Moneuplotes crassus]|uniref:YbaK/aminoacyl-tRNA synthetase-associated domain-containing protein n=1 Tax=Euplotes crassus TaxID=5936 RepID=A0AAD1XYV0_EUPCR|nr:unnamed protein product [Moneuplotes crassus]